MFSAVEEFATAQKRVLLPPQNQLEPRGICLTVRGRQAGRQAVLIMGHATGNGSFSASLHEYLSELAE